MRIINPANDQLLHEFDDDSADTVGEKFARAKVAQRSWSATPLDERLAVMRRFRELVASRTGSLAEVLTAEVGKPIRQSENELRSLLGRIDFFLEHTAAELSEEVVLDATAGGVEERIAHGPLGVIANVSAWNYPYFVGANVFVPALLTGNAVLYKPSEFATLTGLEIARALHDAGVPKQIFATVLGGGAVGALLIEQPLDGVFFTGSVATGRKIAASVAARMIRLQLELGGKDAAYVTDDVDVTGAAAGVADGAFYNTGQSCCAVERIYVHTGIWDAFIESFVDTVRGFALGDPMDEATYIGPLARREAQLKELEAQVHDALDKGARLVTGGKRADRNGYFFEPTVLVDVDHSMEVMQKESFGPIIGLMKVDGDEQATDLMNDSEYGLTAAVYSRSRERAERVLRELDVGTAYWNCCDRVSPRLPWSGRRNSGIGCTLSTYGIEAFLRPKAWHLRGP
ncbi:MAG TPA: aldehyde dehydrogenase family protein [Polyangiaceae bacterium]|nr:aldehyde dehydrogenase family protein [Polyangiaceae bacterium]